jgi:hypothetical protein
MDKKMSMMLGEETIFKENKNITVPNIGEATLERCITSGNYGQLVKSIHNAFSEYIRKILPKYLSQSMNTDEIINNCFTIHFGVTDEGHAIGLPVDDLDMMYPQTMDVINDSLKNIFELSIMKRDEIPALHMRAFEEKQPEEHGEISYTSSTSSVDMDTRTQEVNNMVECFSSIVKTCITFTPVTEFKEHLPEIYPILSDVIEKYIEMEERYIAYKKGEKKITSKIQNIKTKLDSIINTDKRDKFIEWLENIAPVQIPDMGEQFPDLPEIIGELKKQTDNKYNTFELDEHNLIRETNVPPNKMIQHTILNLAMLYRDCGCDQLRQEIAFYRKNPVVPPPSKMYTNICKCYNPSVMNDIAEKTGLPLYVCSISFSNIAEFLKNINLKDFYYENESGMLTCQIRVMGNDGSGQGPISVDKPGCFLSLFNIHLYLLIIVLCIDNIYGL